MTDVHSTITLNIPVIEMVVLSSCIVAATALGVFVAQRFPRVYHKSSQRYLLCFVVVTLSVIVAVNVYIYRGPLVRQITFKTAFFVAVVSAAGYSTGVGVAYLARLSRDQQLTVCLETGTRTSNIVLLLQQQKQQQQQQLLLLLLGLQYSDMEAMM